MPEPLTRPEPLPTVTEKLSKDLGVSDKQLRNRINTVAKATGKDISLEPSNRPSFGKPPQDG